MLGYTQIHDRVVALFGFVFEKMLANDRAGQILARYQLVYVGLRLRGDRERCHSHSALACVLGEGAPASPDVQNAPAGLNSTFADRRIQLATDGSGQRLLIVFEVAVRVAAMFLVQKEKVEKRLAVVVFVYPLFVPSDLAKQQPLTVRRPQIEERMPIGKLDPKLERRNQVALDRYVAVEISLADSLLIHRSQRRHASDVV